jgi:hypothetical protein
MLSTEDLFVHLYVLIDDAIGEGKLVISDRLSSLVQGLEYVGDDIGRVFQPNRDS